MINHRTFLLIIFAVELRRAPFIFILMGISITIREDLLSAAERATHIHDRTRLVEEGLRSLCRSGQTTHFDFDATLAAAAELPEFSDESFESLSREINRPLSAPW